MLAQGLIVAEYASYDRWSHRTFWCHHTSKRLYIKAEQEQIQIPHSVDMAKDYAPLLRLNKIDEDVVQMVEYIFAQGWRVIWVLVEGMWVLGECGSWVNSASFIQAGKQL